MGFLLCLGSTHLQGRTKAPDHDCCHNDNSTLTEAAVSFFIDADGVEYLPTEGHVWGLLTGDPPCCLQLRGLCHVLVHRGWSLSIHRHLTSWRLAVE